MFRRIRRLPDTTYLFEHRPYPTRKAPARTVSIASEKNETADLLPEQILERFDPGQDTPVFPCGFFRSRCVQPVLDRGAEIDLMELLPMELGSAF
jgi:hypothetical protein